MSEKLNIPETWEIATLGEICSIVTDGTHKTPNYVDNGIPFISIANIRPFEPINFNKYVKYIAKKEHIELCKRAKPEKDDILFPRIGTLGYAKRIDFDYEVSIFVGLGLAKPFKEFINSKYLEFFMNTHWVNKFSFENATGTGRLTLPLEASRILPIPIPPLPEQHRIVAKIEELFSSLAKGIESLITAQQQLKVYRQAVLKWAFEGKLTNCELIISKLGEHTDLITKGASPRWQGFNYIEDENQLLFVTSENVRENFMDVSKPKYLSLELNKILKRSILKKEDVLFNLVGASIGRAAIFSLDKIANINQAVAIIRLKESIFNKYLSLFLNAEVAKQKYLEKIVDVARANLSLTDVANIQIPLPLKLEDQHAIVAEIESRLSVCDKIEESIEQSLKQSEALRQSILKKAFGGKLVPQDPNDEPASVLLDRIKAEREKNKSEIPPRR